MLENRLFSQCPVSRNFEKCLRELEAAQRELERIAGEEHYPALTELHTAIQSLITNK